MIEYEEDDTESINCLFCDGHWEWTNNGLKFVSDLIKESTQTVFLPAAIVGPIEFKDNLDVVEQQKFKRRIQRKHEGEDDVITLQDIKDVVLYTAPTSLVTPIIVAALHTHTADRFLRALILYCQYYVQVSITMEARKVQLETKIPTQRSTEIENKFAEDLSELRLLIAKEYCTMIIGGGDFKKFHHKGPAKKQQSMSTREAMLFEPLIRISIQIVWLALGRKYYPQLELEINRMFRSKKFNLAEHSASHVEYKMSQREQKVRTGVCDRIERSMRLHSPFYNEIECIRDVDFRMFGLGVINYTSLNARLKYLESFLITKEADFQSQDISLGILGLNRNHFDILLRELQRPEDERRSSTHSTHSTSSRTLGRVRSGGISTMTKKSSSTCGKHELYRPIEIPLKQRLPLPVECPLEVRKPLPINKAQRQRWADRISRITRRSTTTKDNTQKYHYHI